MRAMLRSLAIVACCSTNLFADGLAPSDAAAVRAVTQEYRDAWLAEDPARVMATLTPDAVLLPSGLPPIEGPVAIRRFWWPSGPATTVTAMELTIDELDGSGDLAVVRGRGTLTFRTGAANAPTTSLRSTFINIVRRQPGSGRWLISRRMWSDLR